MAAVAKFLADTSALVRLRHTTVRDALQPLIEQGLVAACAPVLFETLWSTRSVAEYRTVRADVADGFEWLAVDDAQWQRAFDVQEQLWATGSMRRVPLPDLLVAAVAERHRVTVIHYDADFDAIAAVTDQPTQWIVPRGSVP